MNIKEDLLTEKEKEFFLTNSEKYDPKRFKSFADDVKMFSKKTVRIGSCYAYAEALGSRHVAGVIYVNINDDFYKILVITEERDDHLYKSWSYISSISKNGNMLKEKEKEIPSLLIEIFEYYIDKCTITEVRK